ncbi:hypothetical protein T492DRAFT_869518, partial [Pavlovales sp. CCMP2436]
MRSIISVDGVRLLSRHPMRFPYVPIDLLSQPVRVRSIVEAIAALRHCDKLCTLIAVQDHAQTFTALLPMPESPSASAEAKANASAEGNACVWRVEVAHHASKLAPLPTADASESTAGLRSLRDELAIAEAEYQ